MLPPRGATGDDGVAEAHITPVGGVNGALLFRPTLHVDERGFFCRTFDADVIRTAGIDLAPFIQHSMSRSVRGLHVRRGDGEASSSDAHMA